MSKSIFEKTYILKAQAEKAMIKEFGEGSDHEVVAKADAIPARFVIVEKAKPGVPRLEVNGGAYAWVCEDAEIKVYGNSKEEALAAYEAQVAFEAGLKTKPMADDLPENPEELDFPIHPELAAAEAQMPWLKDEEVKAEKLAHALQVNADLPASKPKLSTCEKPTKKVWHIADSMPKASRKEVIEECVRQGIAYGTSRTQYQAWFKASQEAMRGDIRKPYEKV